MRKSFFHSPSTSIAALAVFMFLLLSGTPSAVAQRKMRKYKSPPPTAHIEVTVLKGSNGKPLQNAAVVFHTLQGDKNDGNMEVKTNEEGKASLDVIPIGSKILLQVISPGFRTYGQQFDIPSDKKTITVKMLSPTAPYSIYGKNAPTNEVQNNTPQAQMGHAAPADSPLLDPPAKKH